MNLVVDVVVVPLNLDGLRVRLLDVSHCRAGLLRLERRQASIGLGQRKLVDRLRDVGIRTWLGCCHIAVRQSKHCLVIRLDKKKKRVNSSLAINNFLKYPKT